MSLDITTRCTLAGSANLRGEHGEDTGAAIDVKLADMEVGIDTLTLLLGADSANEVRAAFWRDDKDWNRRFLALGAVPIDTSVQHLRAKIGCCVFDDVTLKKPQFTPVAGRVVRMTAMLSIPDLDSSTLALLIAYLGTEINLSLTAAQRDLFSDQPAAPTELPPPYGPAHGALDAELLPAVIEDAWANTVHAHRCWAIARNIDNSEGFTVADQVLIDLSAALMDAPAPGMCMVTWIPAGQFKWAPADEEVFTLDLSVPGSRGHEALQIKGYAIGRPRAVSFIAAHTDTRGSVSYGGSMSRSAVERFAKRWCKAVAGVTERVAA